MGTIDLLGNTNMVADTTGKHVRMKHGEAVTFVSQLAAGNQVLTLKESQDGSGEQALSIIDEVYKCPGVGGTWTKVTQTASDTYTHADGTNNAVVFTVRADQLSATFDCVELTASAGWCLAVVTDLKLPSRPTLLPTPVA